MVANRGIVRFAAGVGCGLGFYALQSFACAEERTLEPDQKLALSVIAERITEFKEKYPEGMTIEAFMAELGLTDTLTANMLCTLLNLPFSFL